MLKQHHDLLPQFIKDVIEIIGYTDTYKLVTNLGGSSFHFGKRLHDTYYSRMLVSAIGETSAAKLCAVYGGTREYIPQCHIALLMYRNERFVAEFDDIVSAGHSKNQALSMLCPKYKLSDRQAWEIIKRSHYTPTQQPLF